MRDHLPLFNFWGTDSSQSMAIVTPGWKYIHWYYAEGMKATEELFELSKDGIEMFNTAENTPQAAQLKAMRELYDQELAKIAERVMSDHGYEKYPTLFSRTIPWDQKAPLLKTKEKQADPDKPKKKRKGKEDEA